MLVASKYFALHSQLNNESKALELVKTNLLLKTQKIYPLTPRDKETNVQTYVHVQNGYVKVVAIDDIQAVVEVTLRKVNKPHLVLSVARFQQEKWEFFGEIAPWSQVAEALLSADWPAAANSDNACIGNKTGAKVAQRIIRIADDPCSITLHNFPRCLSIHELPSSSLAFLVHPGSYSMVNARTGYGLRNFELENSNKSPIACIRNDDEFWINDVDSLLKVSTKNGEVLDAVGSTDGGGSILSWSFDVSRRYCAVIRPASNMVVVIDCTTMDSTGAVACPDVIEATPIDGRRIVALLKTGQICKLNLN